MREEQLERIASFGYMVCSIPNGFAIADPLDNEDGFYLEVTSVSEAFSEMEEAEMLQEEDEE